MKNLLMTSLAILTIGVGGIYYAINDTILVENIPEVSIPSIQQDPVDRYMNEQEKAYKEELKRNERILRATLEAENEYQTHKEQVYLPVVEKQKELGLSLEAHYTTLQDLGLSSEYDRLASEMGINELSTTTASR